MKSSSYKSIVYTILFLLVILGSFKLLHKFTQKPKRKIKEDYNDYNGGYGCFGGKLSVPLPGKSKCFDCEREMIGRAGCNIAGGAGGNPSLSFDAQRHAQSAFGAGLFGMPSRQYSSDYQLLANANF